LPENIAVLRGWEEKYGGRHVHLDALKLFLDGTNEIGTSAVIEPFIVGENDCGELRMSEDDLTACLLILNEEDLDLHIHLVGDRAFRTACNALEKARAQLDEAWRIQVTLAHCELIDPADMPRVAELGIIVNWSTHWSGGYFSAQSLEWLGPERFDRMYQFNPIIESGGIVCFSSDVITKYEAHRGDPFFGMQVAHTRIDPEFPIYPERPVREPMSAKLSLSDLVRGYTLNGAIQLRLADRMGSIEVGKFANMAILNRDLFSVPGDQIRTVAPEAVLFEGRVVHGSLMLP
jgi:predicted amidohydrolase YtcJ